MTAYTILNSRKRSIIALVHSAVFATLASYQLAVGQRPTALVSVARPHLAGPLAMSIVYFIVTTVLVTLTAIARPSLERIYFGLCASSAATGLLRVVFGDPTLHFGSMLRVVMLGGAVFAGTMILKQHSTVTEF